MPQYWRGTPSKKRMTFDGKIYTLHDSKIHLSVANKIAKKLREKGWLVRVYKAWSNYSGLEVFRIYKRRK